MQNSPIIITGGASGIGLAVAQSCLEKNWPVALLDMNADSLKMAENLLERPYGFDTGRFGER